MSQTAATAADGAALASRHVLYGIASALSEDLEDCYRTREKAEATLARILRDEPDFEGELWVARLKFEFCPN